MEVVCGRIKKGLGQASLSPTVIFDRGHKPRLDTFIYCGYAEVIVHKGLTSCHALRSIESFGWVHLTVIRVVLVGFKLPSSQENEAILFRLKHRLTVGVVLTGVIIPLRPAEQRTRQ
jgi:hypothetical protein